MPVHRLGNDVSVRPATIPVSPSDQGPWQIVPTGYTPLHSGVQRSNGLRPESEGRGRPTSSTPLCHLERAWLRSADESVGGVGLHAQEMSGT